MPEAADNLPHRIKALREISPAVRLAALSEALPIASERELEPLALELLELAIPSAPAPADRRPILLRAQARLARRTRERRRARADDALLALLSRWRKLPTHLRRTALAAGRGRWPDLLARAAEFRDPAVRVAACRLAEDEGDPALAPALVPLLADDERQVGEASDRALLRLALATLGDLDPENLGELADLARRPILAPPADTPPDPLDAALAEAAEHFADHRRRWCLAAAALRLGAGPPGREAGTSNEHLRRVVLNVNHPAHAAFRTILRRLPVPVLRACAWRWLAHAELSAPAADRVARAEDASEHAAVLAQSHLALHPARARAAARIGLKTRRVGDRVALHPRAPLPDPEDVPALGIVERRAIPRFLDTLAPDDDARRLVLEPLLVDPDELTRFGAARLAGQADLPDIAHDEHIAVARHAALRLSTLGAGAERWPPREQDLRRLESIGVLARSSHAAVRAVAIEELGRSDPFDATSATGRLAARRWLAADEAGYIEQLAELLDPSCGERALRAVQTARTLRLAPRLAAPLIALARLPADTGTPVARLVSAAVATLARVDTPAASRTIEQALGHADPRVRANAMEARLARLKSNPSGPWLVELKDDPQHRVRGTAVRAMIERDGSEEAGQSLGAMLADERTPHRLAGTWVAERALCAGARVTLGGQWESLAHRIAGLASHDPDGAVRRRADRCARRLLAEIRAGWSSSVRRTTAGSGPAAGAIL